MRAGTALPGPRGVQVDGQQWCEGGREQLGDLIPRLGTAFLPALEEQRQDGVLEPPGLSSCLYQPQEDTSGLGSRDAHTDLTRAATAS